VHEFDVASMLRLIFVRRIPRTLRLELRDGHRIRLAFIRNAMGHQRESAEGSLTRKIATSRAPFRDRSDKTHADNGQRGIARSIVS
jgi:hypothetical protein